VRKWLSSVPYLHRHWQPESVLQDFSASASERPVQTLGDATARATRHAVTIETTTAAPALSTGTVAASTRADSITSPSIGWASR
jgi:hypothetical protein